MDFSESPGNRIAAYCFCWLNEFNQILNFFHKNKLASKQNKTCKCERKVAELRAIKS